MWEAIVANRRRSAVLIVGMAVILLIIGFAGGEVLTRNGGLFGLFLAVAIFSVMMIVYFTSAESILMSGTSARELKREDSPQLFNVVDEMCLASGLGFTPSIYLINDPAPNAFAVGRKPETSAIAVTTGLGGGSPEAKPGTMLNEVHRPPNGYALFVFGLPDDK